MKAFTPRRNRGVALLMVLGSLALITVLVVAFLTQTTAELRSAKSFSQGASTRLLADTALNLVMAQIREGTRGYKNQPRDGNLLAWASQPGAIRTFNQQGNLETIYKLYSDDRMQANDAASLKDDLEELKNWASSPAYYTDLNEPVVTGAGGQAVTNYPIMDPAAEGKVEGFEIDDNATPKTARQPAPMPVRWLYVLEDGSLAPAPVTAGGNTVTVSNCSPQNRVIGRIAFWTDDETCKLNINTASEGVFWDVPVGWSAHEFGNNNASIGPFGFANSVPGSEEFQRTPGHPATTCLSPVFTTNFGLNITVPITSSTTNELDAYYRIAPRITSGGTFGGTGPSLYAHALDADRLYASIDELGFVPNRQPQSAQPELGGFTADAISRAAFFLTTHSRAPDTTLFNTPRLSLWPVMVDAAKARNAKDKLLAFCTTANRYPYHFLRAKSYTSGDDPYGNPDAPGSSQSQWEDFPGKPSPDANFDPDNSKTWIQRNLQLYAYLRALTDIDVPGFGGKFEEKWDADRDQNLTLMFNAIRSGVNTFNSSKLPPHYNYTPYSGTTNLSANPCGAGSVVPIAITNNGGVVTRGFGRFVTLGQLAFVLFATDFKDETTLKTNRGGTTNVIIDGKPTEVLVPQWWWNPTHDVTEIKPDGVPDDEPGGPFSAQDLQMGSANFANYAKAVQAGHIEHLGFTNRYDAKQFMVYDGIGDWRTKELRLMVLAAPMVLSPGMPYMQSYARLQIEGLDSLTINGQPLGLPKGDNAYKILHSGVVSNKWGGYMASSPSAPFYQFLDGNLSPLILEPCDGKVENHKHDDYTGRNENKKRFPFVSKPVRIDPPAAPNRYGGVTPPAFWISNSLAEAHPITNRFSAFLEELRPGATPSTLTLSGGPLKIRILEGFTDDPSKAPVVQEFEINVPTMTLPVPEFWPANAAPNAPWQEKNNLSIARFPSCYGIHSHPAWDPSKIEFYNRYFLEKNKAFNILGSAYTNRFTDLDAAKSEVGGGTQPESFWVRIIRKGDVVRAIGPNPKGPSGGDLRLIAARDKVGADDFAPYGPWRSNDVRQIFSLSVEVGHQKNSFLYAEPLKDWNPWSVGRGFKPVETHPNDHRFYPADRGFSWKGRLVEGMDYHGAVAGNIPVGLDGATMKNGKPGDWTAAFGNWFDGPWVTKADEGYQQAQGSYVSAYYEVSRNYDLDYTDESFSPNRQVASAVSLFGTLPSGVKRDRPWETFLFCPNPAAGAKHPGLASPPDHLVLDMFQMPVVEPYAISEGMSTAGRVNMNYAIAPFDYITRDTAVRGVLKSVEVAAVPNEASGGGTKYAYKSPFWAITDYPDPSMAIDGCYPADFRYNVNLDKVKGTLRGFEDRFKTNLFRSASEICSVFLVPERKPGLTYGPAKSPPNSYADTESWWNHFKLTGDNLRESPYNQLYPRLTTKSNTYQVHMRVQALKQSPGSAAGGQWVEGTDQVLGEYRGSAILERYIDPNDPRLPDFAVEVAKGEWDKANMDQFYRFRVVQTRQFNP